MEMLSYSTENITSEEETQKSTRLLFIGVCFYMLSQVYAIPLFAVGPSWALWPNLADLASFWLIGAWLVSYKHLPKASYPNRKLLSILIFAWLGSIISYVFYRLSIFDGGLPGVSIGQYQILRFLQFIGIFWVTAHVPLTTQRRKVLLFITNVVFLTVCLFIVLTLFNILPLATLTGHLPQDPLVAGAWSRYQSIGQYGGQGWGTTGYDHSHVAVNVIMLLAMRLHLGRSMNVGVDKVMLLIAVIACLFSGSRTGLAAVLSFGLMYWFQKPEHTGKLVFLALLIFGLTLAGTSYIDWSALNVSSSEGSLLERQSGLTNIGSDSLSGRDEIWTERIELFAEHPDILFLGSGFGSATDTGKKAHFLLLHVTLETGLIGLTIFLYFFAHVFYFLRKFETDVKPIYLATIAFFVSSLGQDTLYFTVTFIHFTGFYFYGLAIALTDKNNQKQSLVVEKTRFYIHNQ